MTLFAAFYKTQQIWRHLPVTSEEVDAQQTNRAMSVLQHILWLGYIG